MEANTELLHRYIEEFLNRGEADAADAFFAPGYRRHLAPGAESLDAQAQVERLAAIRSAFPDLRFQLEDVVAAGDRVAFRATLSGTHRGAFQGIAPTARAVRVSDVGIMRIEGGRIAEHWGGPDTLDLLRQLGAELAAPGARRRRDT